MASVSNGYVLGKSPGTTEIYATTSNGIRSNTRAVSVEYATPTSVSVASTLYLPINDSKKLSASVSPSIAKTELTWSSDNSSVASVTNDGTVTAHKSGKANIKVTTDNGRTATCVVTVPPLPTKIELPKKISLVYGTSRKLIYKVTPSDAYVKATWYSSNNKVASVSQEGEVLATGAGSAKITVITSNGMMGFCDVDVPEPVYNFVVWSQSGEKITYPLSDHAVVAYSGENVVITTNKSRVEFPATQINKYTLEDLTTEELPSSIYIPSSLTLKYGERETLDCVLFPSDYDILTNLKWETSDIKVANVTQNGVVTARGGGSAVVTVTATNGVSASCNVTVPYPGFYFIVWFKDNTKSVYHLKEQPKIDCSNGKIVVNTLNTSVEYEIEKVQKFTLSDGSDPDSGVELSTDPCAKSNYNRNGNDFYFSGCKPNSTIAIYYINGRLAEMKRADSDGNQSISIENYPMGVYIIKTESITFKIIKK